MKRLRILLLIIPCLALGGCSLDNLFSSIVNEAPDAVIDAKPAQGDAPLTIHVNASFSHDDHGISQYYWDFGDPHDAAPLSAVTATHTYRYPGTYVVKLTVVDDRGALSSQMAEVVVKNPPPDASFTITPSSVTVGDTVHFDASATTDANGMVKSLTWDLGDGAAGAGPKVDHVYTKSGYFVVTLTATDDDDASSTVRHAVVVQASTTGGGSGDGGCSGGGSTCGGDSVVPLAVISGLPSCSGIQPGQSFHLDASLSRVSDGTIKSYAWTFGDGTTAAGAEVDHAYSTQGYYEVSLTVTDSSGRQGTAYGHISVIGGGCSGGGGCTL